MNPDFSTVSSCLDTAEFDVLKLNSPHAAAIALASAIRRLDERLANLESITQSIAIILNPTQRKILNLQSSMATEDRVRPGECHSRPQMPSTAELPSEQVKKVGRVHVNQQQDDPNTVARLQPRAAAQGPLASSEAGTPVPESAVSA